MICTIYCRQIFQLKCYISYIPKKKRKNKTLRGIRTHPKCFHEFEITVCVLRPFKQHSLCFFSRRKAVPGRHFPFFIIRIIITAADLVSSIASVLPFHKYRMRGFPKFFPQSFFHIPGFLFGMADTGICIPYPFF